MCALLSQNHTLAAPPTPTPLPPPPLGEEGIDCAGWGVVEGRALYPLGSEDCPMNLVEGGPLSCGTSGLTKPLVTACAKGTSIGDVDYLSAQAVVIQNVQSLGSFTPPCPCSEDSPSVFLVGERTSAVYSTSGIGARRFEVTIRGRVSLKSKLDITSSCGSSCASVAGEAVLQVYLPLTNPEAQLEFRLNGRRLESVSGAGFCTGQSTIARGFEIGPGGIGADWSFDIGGTVARAKYVQRLFFKANFCVGAEMAQNGVPFTLRGTVHSQASLSAGDSAQVLTEVDLQPVKIRFAPVAGQEAEFCDSCAADSVWSMPTSTGGNEAL